MPKDAPDAAALRADLEKAHRRRRTLRKQVRRLRRRLARAEAELVTASGAVAGHEPDLDYVFVLAYGRSGSTLLQGILSSTPGWLLRGENEDALRPLYDFHRTGLGARERPLPATEGQVTDPWFGAEDFPTAASLRHLRSLALATILRPDEDTRVTGFKEIRWGFHEDLVDYLDFVRALFPGARFVVNTRNLEDVARSKWWPSEEDAMGQLRLQESRILAARDHLGDAAYHVRYDDYVADPASLAPLFAWLGEEYDDARVRGVLATPHSY